MGLSLFLTYFYLWKCVRYRLSQLIFYCCSPVLRWRPVSPILWVKKCWQFGGCPYCSLKCPFIVLSLVVLEDLKSRRSENSKVTVSNSLKISEFKHILIVQRDSWYNGPGRNKMLFHGLWVTRRPSGQHQAWESCLTAEFPRRWFQQKPQISPEKSSLSVSE